MTLPSSVARALELTKASQQLRIVLCSITLAQRCERALCVWNRSDIPYIWGEADRLSRVDPCVNRWQK